MSVVRAVALISLALSALAAVAPAVAQSREFSPPPLHAARPALEGLVAERVPRLAPGVALNFSVFGSAGATVSVYIEGVPRLLVLREVQPGVYEGTHVLEPGDAPRADSRVVATLERNGAVARATLGEPLVLAAMAAPWASARATSPDERPAEAPSRADPWPRAVPPAERPFDARTPALAAASPPMPALAARPFDAVPPAAVERIAVCRDCAVVESIREVEAPARDGVAGVVTRALTDHRRRMLGLLGALGISAAARESERLAAPPTAWQVVLRRPDGQAMARRHERLPEFRIGDVVPLASNDGAVIATGP